MSGIIFGTGFLGNRIGEKLRYAVIGRNEVDVLNYKLLSSFLDREKPAVVINAVGKTHGNGENSIDWCEGHKEETIESNVVGAINLSTACSKRGIHFVHLGSGCIYQGDNNGRGFTEDDEPNFYGPQFYAKTKIDAERTLKNLPGLILRIRMPIDDRPHQRNLIDKLLGYQKVIDAPNSMTTVPEMISALKFLIGKRTNGVYNFTNPRTISAAEIMGLYNRLVRKHEFQIMSIEELDEITVGKRSNCYLNTKKLDGVLKGFEYELPEIHEAVQKCLIKYKKNMKI